MENSRAGAAGLATLPSGSIKGRYAPPIGHRKNYLRLGVAPPLQLAEWPLRLSQLPQERSARVRVVVMIGRGHRAADQSSSPLEPTVRSLSGSRDHLHLLPSCR